MGKFSKSISDSYMRFEVSETKPMEKLTLSDENFEQIISVVKRNYTNVKSTSFYDLTDGLRLQIFDFKDEHVRRLMSELCPENDVLEEITILSLLLSNRITIPNDIIVSTFSKTLSENVSSTEFAHVLKEFLKNLPGNDFNKETEERIKNIFFDNIIPFCLKNFEFLNDDNGHLINTVPLSDVFSTVLGYYADAINVYRFEITPEFLNKYIEYLPAEILLHNLKFITPENKEKCSEKIRLTIEKKLYESLDLGKDELSALNIQLSIDTLSYELFNEVTDRPEHEEGLPF